MKDEVVEIICIGREILDGRVIDTNSIFLAEELKKLGLIPRYAQKVDDDIERIVESFAIAQKRSTLIFVTGGLGPTSDDITAEAFAKFLGKPLVVVEEALIQVQQYFKRIDREMIEEQKKQALLPSPCLILENSEGSAPGFYYQKKNQFWFFMPGVPFEMKKMFLTQVSPKLPAVKGYKTHTWYTQFTSEGELQKRLKDVELPSGFELTYRTRFPENHIGLHAYCPDAESQENFERIGREISRILGRDVFSSGYVPQSLEECVFKLLRDQHFKVGVVESCTGGLVSHRLTNLAGISEVFWSSWVTYDNQAKIQLGVRPETLKNFGAVSRECGLEMAQAGLKRLLEMGADKAICLATTGIAGPTGGSTEKPVGLCYVALASHNPAQEKVDEIRGRANFYRDQYKLLFSQKALDLLRTILLPK